MSTKLSLLRYRAERALMASLDLYEWYRNNTVEPPTYLQLDLRPLADLDAQIESSAKELMGVSEIPADLWSPFWVTHAYGAGDYKTTSEYWGAAVQY